MHTRPRSQTGRALTIFMPIIITIIACFASSVLSQELNFWVQRPGGDQNCKVDWDGTVAINCQYVGGCLYNKSHGKIYCCHPRFSQCTGWKEECDTKVSPTGSSRQVFCRRNSDTWCCDKEQERCASNVTNQCEPKIENPLHNESNSTYTSIKNMTLAGPTGVDRNLQGTAIISKNGGDGSTQTLEPNTNSNGRTNSSDGGSGEPSAGVIAGATLGGLAGLVLIVTGIIWISKGFARKKVITEFRRQQYPQSSWQERTLERGMGRSGSNVQEPPKLVTDDDMWDGGRRVFRP